MRPTGTVTFLFTDIEGSTRLWETHPEEMGPAFLRQESIIRQGIEAHEGYPYKMIGDAFQAAFSSALDALNAAIDIQRRLNAEAWGATPIRVRMALHTGETEERGDDYIGPVLNRLARVLAAGHGGQILLTQATVDLVVDQLPDGVHLVDLGVHRLKDLIKPEHIYQVVAPGLPVVFPPLKTLETLPNNLPLQRTRFIGREKEMAELWDLLSQKGTHLVTLTGPGGTGKTRLALQIAADMLDKFPDGAWFVELAFITDPDLVLKMVAVVLDVREAAETPLVNALVAFLHSKKLLLILDACEHLVDACASLANTLLHVCPDLVILITSREILGTGGEIPFRVPSLALPDKRQLLSIQDLAQTEAVRLFIEHAQSTSPEFTLIETNAAQVVQIVKRLDGIPLAIELAAARVRWLSLAQMAARLDDVFRLLAGSSQAVLARQQAMQALIDWSYDLLSTQERTLLRRLSVFSGGWTLEAAQAVCADSSNPQLTSASVVEAVYAEDMLDILTQLVDKSLVLYDSGSGDEAPYHMLDTIHQYAREKLANEKVAEQNESARIRDQHLAYFLRLAEAGEPRLYSREQVAWLNRLDRMLDNLRLALEWGLEKDIESELRLASALMGFWRNRGLAGEGVQWLNRGLSSSRSALLLKKNERAKALLALGALISQRDQPGEAMQLLEESLALYQSLGLEGRSGAANAYRWMATCARRRGDDTNAVALAQQAVTLFREIGDRFGLSESLPLVMNRQDDPDEVKKIYLRVLEMKREIGDIDGVAFTLQILSQLAFEQGDDGNASDWLEESLECFREVGNRQFTVADLHNKAIFW